tara:strand:- start:156 stop:851 length:696 start_codon:yes stop_codon:yes gene_type:complete
MKTSPELSIVIPVLNEEGSIKVLVNSIEKALQFYSYEIIFVDDGSTDSTVVTIKSLKNSFINLIVFDSNKGQSSALAAGINLARGTYIVTMDGDFQNDPCDIPRMVHMISNENLDMVMGIRKNRQDPILKTFPSKIANFIIRITTQLNITDSGCGLKVMTSKVAKDIPLHGYLHRFMALNAYIKGASINEIPIIHHPRTYGVSKYGLGRIFIVLKDLFLIIFNHKFSRYRI